MNCLNCSSFGVLWNGEKTEAFSSSRGVRQGDPLSPYLFVLCMERLNQIIEDAISRGSWKPATSSRGVPPLSRLFFTDDLLLFGEATVEQARVIKQCLDMFCAASGEKVSTHKSMVFFSKNTQASTAQGFSQELNMPITDDLGRYLGMPLIHGRVTK